MTNQKVDTTDPRWGDYCPWFLRHDDFSDSGDFLLFFDRLSHRIKQLLLYNETGIPSLTHFADNLESKSLQRFRYDRYDRGELSYLQIAKYFAPSQIQKQPLYSVSNRLTKGEQYTKNFSPIINRIGVLDILLQILPRSNGFLDFVNDVRKYLAEALIMLDIDTGTYKIKLLEEPLLQKEVIEKLMPRLASKSPERAKELSDAYHDMLKGEKKFDDIFIGAFKTLEALAREITNDKSFDFKKSDLQKYFPKLHPTVHDTMIKLAAHRGAEGGHGRDAPEPNEMRYLLFSICNVALLLLDYPR